MLGKRCAHLTQAAIDAVDEGEDVGRHVLARLARIEHAHLIIVDGQFAVWIHHHAEQPCVRLSSGLKPFMVYVDDSVLVALLDGFKHGRRRNGVEVRKVVVDAILRDGSLIRPTGDSFLDSLDSCQNRS